MFDYNLRENSTGKRKKMKLMLQCNAKAYQSILQKPIAKKQKRISRTVQITSQTSYRRTWCRQKWNKFEQLLKISNLTDTKWTEKSIFQKNPKIIPLVIKSVLESYFKRFGDTESLEYFHLKPDTRMEKTHSKQWCNFIHQHNEIPK